MHCLCPLLYKYQYLSTIKSSLLTNQNYLTTRKDYKLYILLIFVISLYLNNMAEGQQKLYKEEETTGCGGLFDFLKKKDNDKAEHIPHEHDKHSTLKEKLHRDYNSVSYTYDSLYL